MISPLVMKHIVPEQRNEAEKRVLNGENGIELKIRCYKNGNIKIERVFSK